MQSVLDSIPDITLIYFGITLTATIAYTLHLVLRNLTASLLHILGWASTFALIWPAITCILTILGIWYRLLPASSSSAFSISAIISLLPAAGVTSLALRDAGSSPLARKADPPPPPPPPATVPPSAPPPKPRPRWH